MNRKVSFGLIVLAVLFVSPLLFLLWSGVAGAVYEGGQILSAFVLAIFAIPCAIGAVNTWEESW